MKEILDQMEEHIAAIRNLQRNFDFHSKKLEGLMISLSKLHSENTSDYNNKFFQSEGDD
jgi:phosphoenolpyruvate carboxylase